MCFVYTAKYPGLTNSWHRTALNTSLLYAGTLESSFQGKISSAPQYTGCRFLPSQLGLVTGGNLGSGKGDMVSVFSFHSLASSLWNRTSGPQGVGRGSRGNEELTCLLILLALYSLGQPEVTVDSNFKRGRGRNIDLLFHSLMHSSIDSCINPDQGWNP